MDRVGAAEVTLRVAFDARDLVAPAQRGMVRYIVGLARHLPAHGVRVALFHRRREPLNPAHIDGLGCEVVGLRDCSGLNWEQVSVPAALVRGGYHLYHAVAERGVPLAAPCPVAYTLHSATAASYTDLVRRGRLPGPTARYLGFDAERAKWRLESLYFRLQRSRASHIFTVSEFSRRELIRLIGFRSKRVSVVPLGLPEPFTRTADPPASERTRERLGVPSPYLLNVGGFEPHKNIPGLMQVLVSARLHRPELNLVVVGTGRPPESVYASVAGFGLVPGRDVLFLSNLGDELVDLYDRATVFVSMSWRESFGVPALEAMARGVPVVASGWGAGPEVIGEAGLLVDPRNHQEAAAAVLKMLEPATRAAFAARGREQVKRFTWERAAELTADVYRRMLR